MHAVAIGQNHIVGVLVLDDHVGDDALGNLGCAPHDDVGQGLVTRDLSGKQLVLFSRQTDAIAKGTHSSISIAGIAPAAHNAIVPAAHRGGPVLYAAHVSAVPVFALEIDAVPEDIDELGHVSNIRYVTWVLKVAAAHSVAAGYDMPRYRELGGGFVVRRHEIDYLRPAYAGERIRLETWVDTWKQVSCVRKTSILRIADAHGRADDEPVLLASGVTRWAFIEWQSGRPVRIPGAVKAAFQAPASEQAQNRHRTGTEPYSS